MEHSQFTRLKPNGSKPKRATRRRTGTDWARLRRVSAASIRKGIAADPDARATDEQFWKIAKVVLPTPKEIITMRLDADLLRWFRRERGYQTRINAILRAYMEHESQEPLRLKGAETMVCPPFRKTRERMGHPWQRRPGPRWTHCACIKLTLSPPSARTETNTHR